MDEYRVVYNSIYGGFRLSKEGIDEYNKRTGRTEKHDFGINRDDPILIQLVEEMGDRINDKYSKLKIISFPVKYKDFLDWDEYDGKESVIIAHDKYLIYNIKCTIDNQNIIDTEKIKVIQELYKEYFESTTYKKYKMYDLFRL